LFPGIQAGHPRHQTIVRNISVLHQIVEIVGMISKDFFVPQKNPQIVALYPCNIGQPILPDCVVVAVKHLMI
jgi:hypothetical protein